MGRLRQDFEWDEDKARRNLRKHGVSFDHAGRVLADGDGDRFHLEVEDDREDYGEQRTVTYASDPADRSVLLVILWTLRGHDNDVTRIISARYAEPKDRRFYEQHHA